MKYIIVACVIISLTACDLIPLKSPIQKICQEIAVSRLKHPKSFDFVSVSEKEIATYQSEIYLNFKAWNDFKVPMLHSITCQFQDKASPELLSVKWNGRLIRQHELDEIRENLKN